MFKLLAGLSISTWINAAAVLVAAAMLVGAYTYVGYLEHRIETLVANNATLRANRGMQDAAIKAQANIISQWAESQQELLTAIGRLAQVQEDATAETRRLNETFTGHDLSALATAKPGLVTRRINVGSHRANRMLECASGDDSACARAGDASRGVATTSTKTTKATRRKVDGDYTTDTTSR